MRSPHHEASALSERRPPPASSRPIRILTLVEAITLTGVARSVLSFARAAGSRAFTMSIVITARGGTLDVPLAAAAREGGLSVSVLAERMRFDPQSLSHLRQLCGRFSPDVIQSHAVKSHVLVWASGLWRQHVWIAFHHGYTRTDRKTRAYNFLDRATLRHAHHVVTVAEAFRSDLLRCGVDEARLSVVHNAVPTCPSPASDVRDRLRDKLGIASGTRVVAAVGRLSREKGHIDLIRAFATICGRVPASRLVIAGEGPERARLEREIARLNLIDHVTLLGEMEDVAPLYALADLLALPSLTEGCPTVLLEAIAAGLPVVATRVGGIPEIVTDGRTALLVQPGDVDELARATARMLLDQPLARRLAAAALCHVAEKHTIAQRMTALTAIHYSVLKACGRGGIGSRGQSDREAIPPHRPTRAALSILMVLHAPPSPGELGPARRHRNLLRQLARHHRVSLLSFGTPLDHRRFRDEFGSQCDAAVFCDMRRRRLHDVSTRLAGLLLGRSEFARLYRRRFQRTLDVLVAENAFDLVIFSTTMLGCYRLPDGVPVIGDTHNVEYDNLRRAAVAARGWPRRLYYRVQAALTAREEVRYNCLFSAVLATSPRDASLIAAGAPAGPVHVIHNGLELGAYRVTRRPEAATLLFTGLMSYYPNWHGMLRFIEEVLPLIECKLPDVRLLVVGSDPPRGLRRAARSNVAVTGYVPSVQPYFERATVFVVPLTIGGGTRVKVLEALAHRVPVVSTTIGCEGIDVVHGESVLLADAPEAFAEAVLRVLQDRSLARSLSDKGAAVARRYDWDVIGERLNGVCSEVVTRALRAAVTRAGPSYRASIRARL